LTRDIDVTVGGAGLDLDRLSRVRIDELDRLIARVVRTGR
jgi:hypothetical protein